MISLSLHHAGEHCLQRMLECVTNWCSQWHVLVNIQKTKVVHYRPCSVKRSDFKFLIGCEEEETAHAYNYLGFGYMKILT